MMTLNDKVIPILILQPSRENTNYLRKRNFHMKKNGDLQVVLKQSNTQNYDLIQLVLAFPYLNTKNRMFTRRKTLEAQMVCFMKEIKYIGKVISNPKNITTNPPKSGHYSTTTGHLFTAPAKHMKDEYERKRELELVIENIIYNFKEREKGRKIKASKRTLQNNCLRT